MNFSIENHDLPSDPALEVLLDEALQPEAPPADLADRIMRGTAMRLPRSPSQRKRLVVRLAAVASISAAAVVGAAFVGVWLAQVTSPQQDMLADLGNQINAIVVVEPLKSTIDTRIEQLASSIKAAKGLDGWDTTRDELDDALTQWQQQWPDDDSQF